MAFSPCQNHQTRSRSSRPADGGRPGLIAGPNHHSSVLVPFKTIAEPLSRDPALETVPLPWAGIRRQAVG